MSLHILHIPRDITIAILDLAHAFRPALRCVCRAWAAVLIGWATRPLPAVSVLAADGHLGLLAWTHAIRPFRTKRNALMANAAFGGYEDIVRLCAGWGASNFEQAMWNAAGEGHTRVVDFCRERGATGFNVAMIRAACGGHEALVRRFRAWGANYINLALLAAAENNHRSIVRLCEAWGNESAAPPNEEAPRGEAEDGRQDNTIPRGRDK